MRLAQVMESVMVRHADRPAIGERAKEFVRDPETGRVSYRLLPRYEKTGFRELWARVRAVASEWHGGAEHRLEPGDRVSVLGFASGDYTVVDLACTYLGVVSVPLQTSSPASQQRAVVDETASRVIAASVERLDRAVELALGSPSVERVLVFDFHPQVSDHADALDGARDRLADAGRPVRVDTLPEVLRRGAGLPEAPLFVPAEGDDPLAMLIYTSGSTGTPKGAMYTDRLTSAMWGGAWSKLFSEDETVTFSYMPMSHVAGHSSLKNTLARGGITYFTARSDLSTFFEDIALARPTELSLIPRICELIFQKYQSELDRRTTADTTDRAALEALVKEEIRVDLLGGHVAWAGCASAPLSAELTAFMESLLGLDLHIIYGSTEAAAVSVDGEMLSPPVIDHKIIDVPELGYYRTDSPYPRGELLLKTDALVPGYYNHPELTAEFLDEDGFYRTGDIVAEIGPGRHKIIDRRKSVLKLSQGEFVATARLEAVFAYSPLVRQVFVYGNSERSHLLAVVVPSAEALARFEGRTEELRQELGESFVQVAKEEGLNSYEIPREFLIETEPFSQDNGLLSDHRKLLRPRLLERYRERLEELYADIAAREDRDLLDVRQGAADRPVLETLQRAAQALLAGSGVAVGPSAHFRDLGGDSLTAVAFSDLLDDVFGVRVPVDMIISSATDLRQLAEHVETRLKDGLDRPDFASVHGRESAEVRAADLTLEKFIDAETLAGAKRLPLPVSAGTVLLTGASGYLGRFLTMEWLERLAQSDGRLVCLVRGRDVAAARSRLEESFAGGDGRLAQRFEALAADHLEVVAGDMAEPRLGLGDHTWQRLSEEVDVIVHAGALVNHVLPYNHLFEANVLGSAELIRLALTGRMKPFTYLSSVAVATSRTPALGEDPDVRRALPVQPVDAGYAGGYATSKWAGEVLLREAHDLCGLPVTVFRSNMILAHSSYGGQLNVPDMFSRLLFSVLATGLAPASFYRGEGEERRPRAHYDGLPVDFTAAAVVSLGGQLADGYRTFSLVNPHDDGISLDTFVDWLGDAGHRIERIDDYADWLDRFETAMRALPEEQRRHSSLPLLHGFKEPETAVRGSGIPSDRFRAAVRAARIGADEDVPHISPALIEKYARDLTSLMSA
ncbi:carboxylic acid reductase [Streptomyces sp. NPDC013012]|uniref:carboxylic acid reductase n=1 Tax=Streptomyces sp. NPDC013012 TaxID=3364860 RepID=UPI0036BD8CB5